MKIGGDSLQTTTWSQLIQVFLINFSLLSNYFGVSLVLVCGWIVLMTDLISLAVELFKALSWQWVLKAHAGFFFHPSAYHLHLLYKYLTFLFVDFSLSGTWFCWNRIMTSSTVYLTSCQRRNLLKLLSVRCLVLKRWVPIIPSMQCSVLISKFFYACTVPSSWTLLLLLLKHSVKLSYFVFKSKRPSATSYGSLWKFLVTVDISDIRRQELWW